MSYSRFSESSDIYVYGSERGICCYACSLNSGDDIYFLSYDAAIAHVQQHISAGHKVLSSVVLDLMQDRDNSVDQLTN